MSFSTNNNEKIISKVRRVAGFGAIFLRDLRDLKLLKHAFLGIISCVFSVKFFGIGMTRYPRLGLRCYQGINIFLTERRIYAEYILIKKPIFEILLSNIIFFQRVPLKFGSGMLIAYKKNGQEKYVFLVLRKKDAKIWMRNLERLVKKRDNQRCPFD